MFKIGDYVVYNLTGVYRIVDIRTEKDIENRDTQYYILRPAFGGNLTVKIPTDCRKVYMRQVGSREDILELMAGIADTETAWIDDARERNHTFKSELNSGECRSWVKLVKTLYLQREEKSQLGKKLMKTDEEIMKAAEKNLSEEVAIALSISPDEVPAMILGYME